MNIIIKPSVGESFIVINEGKEIVCFNQKEALSYARRVQSITKQEISIFNALGILIKKESIL